MLAQALLIGGVRRHRDVRPKGCFETHLKPVGLVQILDQLLGSGR
jgi:hypothetical protein